MVLPGVARAHVSVVSGPGFANTTQEIVFGVGHGCAGADTTRVRVEIPAGVLSPDQPFKTIFFVANQTCRAADGTMSKVDWKMLPTDCSSDSGRPTNAGTGGTGGGGGLVGCLDTPGTLDRPPNGRLPCELIPPGLRL